MNRSKVEPSPSVPVWAVGLICALTPVSIVLLLSLPVMMVWLMQYGSMTLFEIMRELLSLD